VGLFDRLFGKSEPPVPKVAPGTYVEATLYTGGETLEAVGESHYQDTLWRIVGGPSDEHVRHYTVAVLLPEPDNPYDANAVQVLIDAELVGYLSREDAAAYRPGLLRLMESSANGLVALECAICGGGERADGLGLLGVFLDHDPADFGLTPHRGDPGRLRTGLSEAIDDVSWYRDLSHDDAVAIRQLRRMLDTVGDPIDRHYMMSELEHRLYRCRDAFSSALSEYDEACREHDAAMATIRPALLEKFSAIPLIDTYRQAAIRCQKAHDWATMRYWAERGLSVYGDEAARSEDVDDLTKRLAHAIAKLEATKKPKPRPRAPVTVALGSRVRGEIETLLCAECGRRFERVRTRGRKPHLCPACRGA
jgi:HIRAN domain